MSKRNSSNSPWIPWMDRALQLASLAEGDTSPNPLVGAIVLDQEGVLIGEGFHAGAGRAHAEIQAFAQAGSKARGGTLVVTLEPCCHHGKTPPCTDAVLNSGVKRVVVAMKDPDPRVSGEGLKLLRDSGLEVITGVLEAEAAFQNRDFIFRVRNGRPWGILKWAMSLDGRIALPNGESQWISNQDARNNVYQLRSKCDAVIIGGGTLRKDNPLLTSRGIADPEPLRVVLTQKLDLPLNSQLWDTSVSRTLIACGIQNDEKILRKIPIGPELVQLETCNPINLLEALVEKNCNRVLWECGPVLASLAIQQGCVQELVVILSPKLLGGEPVRTPLAQLGFSRMDQALVTKTHSLENLGDNWIIKAQIPMDN